MHAYRVEAHVGDGFAGGLYEGRDVLVHQCSALQHNVASKVAELVDETSAANYSGIVDVHFAGYLRGVGHDYAVAEHAVVCHMAVCHDKAVFAHYGLACGGGAAVNGGTFVYRGAVADICVCLLAAELEVLRHSGYHGAGEEGNPVADAGSGENGDVTVDDAVVADFHVVVDTGEAVYLHVVAYSGFRRYIYIFHDQSVCDKGGERGVYLFLIICAMNSASATIFSPTKA